MMNRIVKSMSFFRSRWTGSALVGLFLFLCPIGARAGDSSELLLARFRAEAPAAWKIVEAADELPGTIKVNVSVMTYAGGKLKDTEEKTAVIKRKPDHYLFTHKKKDMEIVYGRNSYYSFEIAKLPDKEDWLLVGSVLLKEHKRFAQIDPTLIEYLRPNGYGFLRMLGPVSHLTSAPGFKAKRAEIVDSDRIRIHFETVIIVPKLEITVKGWMDFDPNNSWVLCAVEKKGTAGGGISKLTKTFSAASRDSYRPCVSWEIKGIVNGSETTKHTQFEIVNGSSPLDAEFYLSAFGLPEPVGVVWPKPTKWWVWFALAALGAVGVGVLLRTVKRRYFDPKPVEK